jgi:hypothetical protein
MDLMSKYRMKAFEAEDLLKQPEAPEGIMMAHMKRLLSMDMAKDSSLLHESILKRAEKIVKAFNRGDYGEFMTILPELEELYERSPEDRKRRRVVGENIEHQER